MKQAEHAHTAGGKILKAETLPPQPNLPVLLSRIKKVAKVFLATNSDYNYTEVTSWPFNPVITCKLLRITAFFLPFCRPLWDTCWKTTRWALILLSVQEELSVSLYSGSSSERVLALFLRPDRRGHQEATVLCRRDRAETSGHGRRSSFHVEDMEDVWLMGFWCSTQASFASERTRATSSTGPSTPEVSFQFLSIFSCKETFKVLLFWCCRSIPSVVLVSV